MTEMTDSLQADRIAILMPLTVGLSAFAARGPRTGDDARRGRSLGRLLLPGLVRRLSLYFFAQRASACWSAWIA